MKPIKIIALDLDGTLLNSEKKLSDRSREALTACARLGIHIVPTTGRAAAGVPSQVLSLPGVRYAITTNGGTVADLKTGAVLDRRTISNSQALRLLYAADRYDVMYDPYIEGRGITQPQFFNHMERYHLTPVLQEMVRATRDVVPNILEYVERCGCQVEKINVFAADPKEREALRQEFSREPGIVITSSMPNNLEVNAESATKGRALMWLADYLGVDRGATMAFGDGENDVSMIRAAGMGIAMENGIEAVKQAADYITAANDEDGVAAALERFILDGGRGTE